MVTLLSAAADASPADWIVASVTTFGESVLSIVPAGFAAYVRVFHPAYRGPPAGQQPVRWAEIAALNGRIAHAGMQLGALTTVRRHDGQPGVFDVAPEVGSAPPHVLNALLPVLRQHTTTPSRCWFAVWGGFGDLRQDVSVAPTFETPGRVYYLLSGPVAAGAESVREPFAWYVRSSNLWWPDDHAWCVATEIDLDSTYIGCTERCADALLAQPQLEAIDIQAATGISRDSDTQNPIPPED